MFNSLYIKYLRGMNRCKMSSFNILVQQLFLDSLRLLVTQLVVSCISPRCACATLQ